LVLPKFGAWCSQKGVLSAAYACLALGALGIIKAAQQIGDMRVVGLLSAAILCGYVYQVFINFPFLNSFENHVRCGKMGHDHSSALDTKKLHMCVA
jgi:hypothetical protein